MLVRDQGSRLSIGEIKSHVVFDTTDWDDVYYKKVQPPQPVRFDKKTQTVSKVFDSVRNSSTSIQGWSFVK